MRLATLTKISASPEPAHHSHTGAIAGGVVSGIAGVAIIIAILFCFFRRRRRSRHGQQASSGNVSYTYELPSEHKHELEHPASEMADPASETADPASDVSDPATEVADPAIQMYAGHIAAYWQKCGLIRQEISPADGS